MLEQFMENCMPWDGPILEKVIKDCIAWVTHWSRGSHAGAGGKHEEDGAAEILTATPFPIPLYHSGVGGTEFGSEFEPVKKGGVGGRCF